MLNALKSLPEDPAELRAVSERLMAEVQSQAYQIEKLKAELHDHRKARFGSKSESLDQLAFDLAEDVEIEVAAEAQKNEPTEANGKPPKRQHSRKPLPDHLDRQDEVLSAGDECGECGGSLRQIGEDITEELEYVPGRFVVRRLIRPRMACTCCEVFPRLHCHHVRLNGAAPARAFWPTCWLANTAITCRWIGNPKSSRGRRSICIDQR